MHEGMTMRRGMAHFYVICCCGWYSGEYPSGGDAEREHALHAELATATAEDFAA